MLLALLQGLDMSLSTEILEFMAKGMLAISIAGILPLLLAPPFKSYPYFEGEFDVTGMDTVVDQLKLLDDYLEHGGFREVVRHQYKVKEWRKECGEKIARSRLKRLRYYQLAKMIDDGHAYRFRLIRTDHRRFKFSKRTVKHVDSMYSYSYEDILRRHKAMIFKKQHQGGQTEKVG
jgi:hypothetical protein